MSIVDEQLFNEDSLSDNEALADFDNSEVTPEDTGALDMLENSVNDEIPEKFKGKELNDVIKSYSELEKELGRKNNEVGELRKVTDDYIKQQLTPTKEVEKRPKIDLDDLLEDPDAVIRNALDNNPRVTELENQLKAAKVEEQRKVFEAKHGDWQDTLSSPDFQDWIGASAIRKQMFAEADRDFNYAVADELFSLYGDLRGANKQVAEEKAATNRRKALKASTVEKGSTGEAPKKVYKRTDIIRLKQTDPRRYADMADDIMLAYQEGRVR